jgi:hypothetical protein
MIVKKILVVILALVYFVAGSGLLLRNHYCGGEYVATQLDFTSLSQTELCDSCGMEEEEEGGCCESKSTFIKKAFDQQISESQDVALTFFELDLLPPFIIPKLNQTRLPKLVALQPLQKPPPKSFPIFKEICCFRI